MEKTIIDEYYQKLQKIFDSEGIKRIKLSDLVEIHGFKLIDITILFTCVLNECEFVISDDKFEVSKYIEEGKSYKFPNIIIERIGDEDG